MQEKKDDHTTTSLNSGTDLSIDAVPYSVTSNGYYWVSGTVPHITDYKKLSDKELDEVLDNISQCINPMLVLIESNHRLKKQINDMAVDL